MVAPPTDCQRILIVGAGGFAREVHNWARVAWPCHAGLIKGFLSADPCRLEKGNHGLGVVGDPAEFMPAHGDFFILGIGIPGVRRRVAEGLQKRDARFLTLVHPTAIVAESAHIGTGCVLCPYAIVSDAARLGNFALLNYYSSIGHDAAVGDYTVLSPYATLGGGSRTEDDVFLGLHASIGPGRTAGARSKISANSCCLNDASEDSIVYGVPGRVTRRVVIASPTESSGPR
jgi:sugar O-acyltransferase (sialic acid O-acetyltransferase NeuD family)